MKYNHIIHIGLGKVASSSLQNEVFPVIVKCLSQYQCVTPENDPDNLLTLIRRVLRNIASEAERIRIMNLLAKNNYFISYEGLISWNPYFWDESIVRLNNLFGANCQIIVVFRLYEGYLKSIYQQALATGMQLKPEEYFLSNVKKFRTEEMYENRSFYLDYYNPDFLVSKLSSEFTSIKSYYLEDSEFLNKLFDGLKIDLGRDELRDVINNFNFKRKNISYNRLSMNIVFIIMPIMKFLYVTDYTNFCKYSCSSLQEVPIRARFFLFLSRAIKKIHLLDRLLRIFSRVFPGKKFRLIIGIRGYYK